MAAYLKLKTAAPDGSYIFGRCVWVYVRARVCMVLRDWESDNYGSNLIIWQCRMKKKGAEKSAHATASTFAHAVVYICVGHVHSAWQMSVISGFLIKLSLVTIHCIPQEIPRFVTFLQTCRPGPYMHFHVPCVKSKTFASRLPWDRTRTCLSHGLFVQCFQMQQYTNLDFCKSPSRCSLQQSF
jgi:hypothetical protein